MSGPHPLVLKSAGHWFRSRDRIAKVGTRNANVPPWTMGRLEDEYIFPLVNFGEPLRTHRTPKVAWRKVTMPETNMIVEMM